MPKMFEAEPLMRLFQNGAKSNRGTWNGLAYYHAQKILERQPTVEAEPIRHGRWLFDDFDGDGLDYQCSVCKLYARCEYNYCPNCGAKMHGGT